MNIKTFAVVKCWVMSKKKHTSGKQRGARAALASRVSQEGWQECFGGMHATPQRWAGQVRALG